MTYPRMTFDSLLATVSSWHISSWRPVLFPVLLGVMVLGLFAFERRRRQAPERSWYPPRGSAGPQLADAAEATPLNTALVDGKWREALLLLSGSECNDATHAYHLGLCYDELGAWREAESCYRSALDLEPAHRNAGYNLARLLATTGRVPEAIGAYRLLLTHHEADADAQYNLGHLYFALKLLDPSHQAWKSAKLLEPDADDVRANLRLLSRVRKVQRGVRAASSSEAAVA